MLFILYYFLMKKKNNNNKEGKVSEEKQKTHDVKYAIGNYLITCKYAMKAKTLIVTKIVINKISSEYGKKIFSEVFNFEDIKHMLLKHAVANGMEPMKLRVSPIAKAAIEAYKR